LGGAEAGAVASAIRSFHGLVLDTLSATETELARVVAGTVG
jgi:hypothetical protein